MTLYRVFRTLVGAAALVLGVLAALTVLLAPADTLTKLILLTALAATAALVVNQQQRALAVGLLAVVFVLGLASIFSYDSPLLTRLVYILLLLGALAVPAAVVYFRAPPIVGLLLLVGVALLLIVAVNAQSIYDWVVGALDFVFNAQERIPAERIVYCYSDPGCSGIYPIVFALILFFVVLTGFAYTTLLERKLLAWIQSRVGPNRIGPGGFFQPVADGLKLIFKEDIMPAQADRFIWTIAPVIKAVPVLILFAVIPWGPNIIVPWFGPALGDVWFEVPLGLADPNVGVLWLLAITSLGTYGVVLAGWASASKYAMLGGLRSSAQMISYELSLGLALVVPILLAGSMSVGDMIRGQTFIWEWYIFQNPLAAAILMLALLAEVNRAPFDLPEAEQELTQGYQTEYSGMKFALFMMAEYLGMIAVSMIVASTFLGGYNDGFGLVNAAPILGPLVLFGKVVLLLVGMIWVRATLPRIRYDRLMALGWKVMLPLALVAVMWTAVAIVVADAFGSPIAYAVAAGVMFAALMVGAYFLMGRPRAEADEADEALDPMITGQRSGVGYAVLNVMGGILAGPFVLYNWLLKALDRLGSVGEPPETSTAVEKASEKKPVSARDTGTD